MTSPSPSEGENPRDEQSETTSAPYRGGDAPTGSRVQMSAWLLALGLVLLLFLGMMVAWGFGMLDSGGG